MSTSFDAAGTISTLAIPSLHIHGERDEIIDIDLGRSLYDAASGPKVWYEVHGAGHNDTHLIGGADYVGRVAQFARSCVHP